MKKLTTALTVAVAIGALAAIPAVASAATQVKITTWKVHTSDGAVHKVKPGDTLKVCASHPADDLVAKGKVQGAKKGKSYDELWSSDGKRFAKFSETWRKSGDFTFTFGIGAEGFQPAKYGLKLVEGSNTIGKSNFTLKTKKGC